MKAWTMVLGAGLLAASATQANATVSLYAQSAGVNGGNITYLTSDPGSGTLSYNGTYGSFTNGVTAFGAPLESAPNLLTQTLNVSTSTSGLLSLFLVQSGVVGAPLNLLSTFTANAFTGAVTSVVETTYASQNNPFTTSALAGYNFSASKLASASFSQIGTSISANSIGGITGSYYQVARYDVNFAGSGSANNTINISGAVPEPASWVMMMVGFGLMGYVLRQRRRTTVSFA